MFTEIISRLRPSLPTFARFGIDEIVDLGDMASGPLDVRKTMDILMSLDAVHVLGNHDRYLIDRPPEKMGSWDRPSHAQLDAEHLGLAAGGAGRPTRVPRSGLFWCHATPARDEVYWLENVLPDGTVRMSSHEAIEKAAGGIAQSAYSLRPHPHCARGPACGRTPDRQSRQRRIAGLPRCPPFLQRHRGRHAGCAIRDPRMR